MYLGEEGEDKKEARPQKDRSVLCADRKRDSRS
jgi:hypothetical protein